MQPIPFKRLVAATLSRLALKTNPRDNCAPDRCRSAAAVVGSRRAPHPCRIPMRLAYRGKTRHAETFLVVLA